MKSRQILAIDIGGTKTKIACLRDGGLRMLFHGKTLQDPEQQLESMTGVIRDGAESFSAIAIGCPGPLDVQKGVILSPPNLRDYDNFPLKEYMEKRLGVPVYIENDANLAALGEAWRGPKIVRNLFYMTVSTGIGVGIVHEGRIFSGNNGLAGECWSFVPGHFFAAGAGVNTGAGAGAGAENILDLAAGAGMVAYARKLIGQEETLLAADDVSTRSIIAAWKAGDAFALRILERARNALAATLCFVVTLLDPELIVLGGGLCTEEEWIIDPVREKLRRMLPEGIGGSVRVQPASLGGDAVLHGALCYADGFTHSQ